MSQSPFTPSYGVSPPVLVDRDEVVADVLYALDGNVGSLDRSLFCVGPRGVGKTVLLEELADQARSRGWIVVSETGSPGFVARLVESIGSHIQKFSGPEAKRRVSGLTTPFGGVRFDSVDGEDHQVSSRGLRGAVEEFFKVAPDPGTGLMFTVDEIHQRGSTDLAAFGEAFQHLRRENFNVAFAGAVLPDAFAELIDEPQLTFVRRSRKIPLGYLSNAGTAQALAEPITRGGRHIAAEALEMGVDASEGYPFLVQLIGDYAWRANPSSEEITAEHMETAIDISTRRMAEIVVPSAVANLSDEDKRFLLAMSLDHESSKMSDIRDRLGRSAGHVNTYKNRLLDVDLISKDGRGKVKFTLPTMREWVALNLNTASSRLSERKRKPREQDVGR